MIMAGGLVFSGWGLFESIQAAKPPEDFINYYADTHIEQIEKAASNPGMAKALSHASVRDADNPVAARLTAIGCQISGQVSSDGS